MKRFLFCSIVVIAFASGCYSVLKVTNIDPATGYFPGGKIATIVINEPVDLDSMKSLVVVTGGDFLKGQVQNIGYFKQVIDHRELEREIVKMGLQEKIPTIQGGIGMNQAYRNYKPFLWLRSIIRGAGLELYAQYILTDPATLKDIFIAEERLDFMWKGVNDQSVWYPLSNALVKYIREHSNSKFAFVWH